MPTEGWVRVDVDNVSWHAETRLLPKAKEQDFESTNEKGKGPRSQIKQRSLNLRGRVFCRKSGPTLTQKWEENRPHWFPDAKGLSESTPADTQTSEISKEN